MSSESSLTIASGHLRAEFWPGAGLLCVSLRYRGRELLRRIDDLEAAKQKGSTAGIPLLYPWANRLGSLHYDAAGRHVQLDPASPILHFDEHGLPMHGVAWGRLQWTVLDRKEDSVLARLDWNGPELLPVFPFPHSVEIAAKAAPESLSLHIAVFANGGSPVPISFGFHPYFGIPDLPRNDWRIKMPAMRRLSLDSRGIPTGAEQSFRAVDELLGERSYDDGFALVDEQPSFRLSGGPTSITIRFLEGFSYTQVFAPSGRDLMAIEPMTARTNALVSGEGLRILESGGQFRASYRITVETGTGNEHANQNEHL